MTRVSVVVTGSECTGKTSLASELARHFGATLSLEFAREYALAKGTLGADDVDAIARGQLELESVHGGGLGIKDTDLLSTVIYARHYYGACHDWVVAAARERMGDLYLLLDIDVPWQADGVRDRGESREELHALFVAALEELGAKYVVIRGTWDERKAKAIAAVESVYATR